MSMPPIAPAIPPRPTTEPTACRGNVSETSVNRFADQPWCAAAAMLIMPTAGYVASNFSKFGVNYFNAVLFPPWGVDDRRIYAVFNTTHVVTSYVFVTLIVIHVLAALRHLYLRNGVFRRMWPARGSP